MFMKLSRIGILLLEQSIYFVRVIKLISGA